MTDKRFISYDRPTFLRLKEKYAEAVNAGASEFIFVVDGNEYPFLTNYAKYVIEYLAAKFGR